MWYSFLGTALTVLFGVLISLITEKISETKILNLTNSAVPTQMEEKPCKKSDDTSFSIKNGEAIFIVEKYRKKSNQTHHTGFDNIALKIEEA